MMSRQVRRGLRCAAILAALIGVSCSEEPFSPGYQRALEFEGLWVSTDSLEADVGMVGVLELDLEAKTDGFFDLGGSWRLGDASGEVYPAVVTLPEGDLILGLSAGAQVRGTPSGDTISGVISGFVSRLNASTWNFDDVPVTLVRQSQPTN